MTELYLWLSRHGALLESINSPLSVLHDFLNLLEAEYANTNEGKEARAQLQLWLKLYAGLNTSTRASPAESTTTHES